MKRLLLWVAACCLLTACVSADMRTYGTPDPTDHSVTVPPGGDLVADIKDVFHQAGWTMVVAQGPDVTQGTLGANTNLQQYQTYKTRYLLEVVYRRFDTCLGHMDGAYDYNMSMIDTKTGQEIMAMGGRACNSQIVEKIRTFLNAPKP